MKPSRFDAIRSLEVAFSHHSLGMCVCVYTYFDETVSEVCNKSASNSVDHHSVPLSVLVTVTVSSEAKKL